MKIIDINTMIGPWPSRLHRFNDEVSLIKEMDSYRITSAITYSSIALNNPKEGNKHIKDIAEASNDRIKACYILDSNIGSSEIPDASELMKQLKEEKPSAVKLYPNRNKYYLDSFYCGELLEVLDVLNMPVIIDSDQITSFKDLPQLAKSYSNIKFIILRYGFRESRTVIPLVKKLDNVYFDISVMVDTGLIEEIVNKYGSDKLLFGSGLPFYVPAGSLGMVIYARLKNSDKEKIFTGNWEYVEGGINYGD
ncbi:MAG TPA: amidohydrolase family protein [Clostridiales bacterium]|nr:amidohydrolase family protein [Clostridiales bacterium]